MTSSSLPLPFPDCRGERGGGREGREREREGELQFESEIDVIVVCIQLVEGMPVQMCTWRNPVRGFTSVYYIRLDAERYEEFNSSGIILCGSYQLSGIKK